MVLDILIELLEYRGMTKSRDIDWQGIELDYRAGVKSLVAIGEQFGVSDAGILKRAKRDGWARDLSKRIKAETARKVVIETVARGLSPEEQEAKLVSENELVSVAANQQTGVVFRQRQRIERLTGISDKLTEELEKQIANAVELDVVGDLLHSPDEKGRDKLNEIYQKVISFPGRVTSLKNLVETSKTLIALERQNVGLADNANGEADKPAETADMSEAETARRIAFVFASAMHKKGTTE
jgi:hypothetical protein